MLLPQARKIEGGRFEPGGWRARLTSSQPSACEPGGDREGLVMSTHASHHPSGHGLPRYDLIEILLLASGVLVLTVVALVAF